MQKALVIIILGVIISSCAMAHASSDKASIGDTVYPTVTHKTKTLILPVTETVSSQESTNAPSNAFILPRSGGIMTNGSEVLVLAAFLTGGILWSISGYLSNWRAHVQYVNANPPGIKDPNWNGFDREGLRDDILIGIGLGAAAVFTSSTLNIPPITDFASFGSAVVSAMGAVALVDKTVVSTVLNR